MTVFESFSFQITVLLMLALAMPAATIFFGLGLQDYRPGGIQNSLFAAFTGIAVGLLLLRKLTAFPGVGAFGYILPSFVTSYGLILVALFAVRYDYSRLFLSTSFALAVAGAFLLSYTIERNARRRFFVVPHGCMAPILYIEGVEWIMMSAPVLPQDRESAIVADLRYDHAPEWEHMLAKAAVRGHPVYHTKQLGESLTGRVSIEHLSENSFGSLMPNLAFVKIKRFLDIAGVLLLLPIILPVMAVISVLILLDSRGPVLFFQERMGYRGRPFWMYKFRTMRARSPLADQGAAIEDAMTKDEDERITRVGRILRRLRLDELPQVINVLKGEMSLIGPRPEAVPLSRWYETELPFYLYRHIVRPGITGWAQVNQGHVTDLEAVNQKLTYDFYYIKNFSAWLDMLIALRTIPTMLSGYGSR
ncbi:sugar transferase [Sphingomonas sp. CGMCC 1.13658]|uniref:sugar transferase n=1 Tax=Sphingomonas sp. CGMCC 1.13658 TaxID=2755554 RepID=UPI002867EF41|nr:sugar transferase [Sphingomonas sp. CGMCC 1.13658]